MTVGEAAEAQHSEASSVRGTRDLRKLIRVKQRAVAAAKPSP